MDRSNRGMKARLDFVFHESLKRDYDIRHFIRYARIANFVNGMHAKRVLDVGCGIGAVGFLLTKEAIVGVDMEFENIREARRIERSIEPARNTVYMFVVADLHFMPFREKFDVIICSEVLEHLSDDRGALDRILPYLKEDGFLVVIVPNLHRLTFRQLVTLKREIGYMSQSHIREYEINNIYRLFKGFPLKIEKITGIYLVFPFFHILSVLGSISRKSFYLGFNFTICKMLCRLYSALWLTLEKIFWHYAYYILVILRKVPTNQSQKIVEI